MPSSEPQRSTIHDRMDSLRDVLFGQRNQLRSIAQSVSYQGDDESGQAAPAPIDQESLQYKLDVLNSIVNDMSYILGWIDKNVGQNQGKISSPMKTASSGSSGMTVRLG